MDNLILAFNVVAPLVLYMAIGRLLNHFHILTEKTCRELSQGMFYTMLPALCCDNIRKLDFSAAFSDPFALYMDLGVLIIFVLALAIVPIFCKENARRGVLIQGIFRSNDGVFGLAVGMALLSAADFGLMVLCVAVTIPVYNLLAVIDMEYFRGGHVHVGHILIKLVKNPIIIGCAAGAALSLFHVELPPFLAAPLSALSGACAPLGFIALGGALSFASLSKNRLALLTVSIVKLIAVPVAAIGVFYLLGYRGVHLLVTLVIFGAPTAMSLFPMSSAMGGDSELAAGTVAVTSVLSLLTMFLFIFILKELGVA